jgi:hypothetical protein
MRTGSGSMGCITVSSMGLVLTCKGASAVWHPASAKDKSNMGKNFDILDIS